MNILGYDIDAPALTLFAMGAGLMWLMWCSSKAPDSFWASAFKDDSGKVTLTRLAMLVALGASTWHLIYVSMNTVKDGKDLAEVYSFYATYLIVWAGTKPVEKLLDVLLARFGLKPPGG